MRRRLLLVTGLSGAGLSTSLKTLEDLGYEALDNLPLFLLDTFLETPGDRPVAIGIDTRTRDFNVESLIATVKKLKNDDRFDFKLYFIDCEDEVLQRRFTETRRRHPLAFDRPVKDGICGERALLEPLMIEADLVLDTSNLTIHDVRRVLGGEARFLATPDLQISCVSFSYRFGLPREADLIFDVRFLHNPHYVPELRHKTGLDSDVAAYIEEDPEFKIFFERLIGFLTPLLPRFRLEGKSYLTIGIGCTGGRHRSVYIAERLGTFFEDTGCRVSIQHRDIQRQLESV